MRFDSVCFHSDGGRFTDVGDFSKIHLVLCDALGEQGKALVDPEGLDRLTAALLEGQGVNEDAVDVIDFILVEREREGPGIFIFESRDLDYGPEPLVVTLRVDANHGKVE